MNLIYSVSDMKTQFTWVNFQFTGVNSKDYHHWNLVSNNLRLASISKSPRFNSFIRIYPEFLKYFKFYNMDVTICNINNTIKMKIYNTSYLGYLSSNYILLAYDDKVYLSIRDFINEDNRFYVRFMNKLNEQWDSLVKLAGNYNNPINVSQEKVIIEGYLNAKHYDPLILLRAMELSNNPIERVTYMRAHKESLMLKLAGRTLHAISFITLPNRTIKIKPEFMQINELQ